MGRTMFSDEQKIIIDARNTNLMVSAAAGAGKTFVLVERIFKLISEPDSQTDIDRLLIMTFTNAAAAEMRERIGGRINAALEEDPDNKRLQRQRMLLHNAQIVTIDSFCISVVKEFFHLIELDPGFRIGEGPELGLLSKDTLSEVIEEGFASGDESFLSLIETFSDKRSEKKVEELIIRLWQTAASFPYPLSWLESLKESIKAPKGELEELEWVRFLMKHSDALLDSALEMINTADMCARMPDGPEAFLEMLASDRAIIEAIRKADTYKERYELVRGATFTIRPRKKCNDEYLRNKAATLRDEAKGIVTGILQKKLFTQNASKVVSSIELMEMPLTALIDITIKYTKLLLEKKRDKNVFDFNDIEHFALGILTGKTDGGESGNEGGERRPLITSAAKALRERYREVFIDEYQDSNFIQEEIAEAITGEKGVRPFLFTVGDVKQSIYRFRMAKPQLFLDRFKRYSDTNGEDGIDIVLDTNYRSMPLVLESTNDVFFLTMSGEPGGIVYDDSCSLKPAPRERPGEERDLRTELLLVDMSGECGEEQPDNEEEKNDEEVEETPEQKEAEARAVADEIERLMTGQMRIEDKEGSHIIRYSDIAVLQRTNGEAEAFLKVFAQRGIPAYASSKGSLFASFEVGTILEFLKLLDNPRQDIPLAAVMHSPMFSFTSEELARIRLMLPYDKMLIEAVEECAESYSEGRLADDDRELGEKVKSFLDTFNSIRSINLSRDIDKVIAAICEKTGFEDYCAGLVDGEKRVMNIELLLSMAAKYESGSYSGLFSFVRYAGQLIESKLEAVEASASSGLNAVTFTTMHKSKGLEYPVVFVTGLCRHADDKDVKSEVLISAEYGLASPVIDIQKRIREKSLHKIATSLRMHNEYLAEEMRLLYVAMTRAKQKLYLTGAKKLTGKLLDKWQREADKGTGKENARNIRYPYSYIVSVSSFMDLIYPAAARFDEHFKIRQISAQSLITKQNETLRKGGENLCDTAEGFTGEAEVQKRKAQYVYPFADEKPLPMKLTVSELKKRSMLEEDESEMPDGLSARLLLAGALNDTDGKEDRSTGTKAGTGEEAPVASDTEKTANAGAAGGASLGTLYHKVLRFIPYDTAPDGVAEYLDSLACRDIISKDEEKLIKPERITAFLKDPITKRMQKADAIGLLRREQPFVLGVRACDISKVYEGRSEYVPVQGVIDCFFEEEGQIVLLDYKTDRIKTDASELRQKYSVQLKYYADAIERLTGMKVKEKILYSLYLGESVMCEE